MDKIHVFLKKIVYILSINLAFVEQALLRFKLDGVVSTKLFFELRIVNIVLTLETMAIILRNMNKKNG